jgi:hypothetical protein
VQKYSGSFNLTIAKAAEEEKPPVLSEGENVTLKVAADSQSCAVFTPEETGFYRFGTQLKNSDRYGGYSVVSSVTSQDKRDSELTDGICMLEKGKEYYVWVAVYETSKKNSRVKLSCTGMDSASTAEKGEVRITGDTVIEYKPAESGNIAVYSVSDGDPKAIIYEKAGFPLRTDDDTEASLNENPDDFAVTDHLSGLGGSAVFRKKYQCQTQHKKHCEDRNPVFVFHQNHSLQCVLSFCPFSSQRV